jgi:hypothetical protein
MGLFLPLLEKGAGQSDCARKGLLGGGVIMAISALNDSVKEARPRVEYISAVFRSFVGLDVSDQLLESVVIRAVSGSADDFFEGRRMEKAGNEAALPSIPRCIFDYLLKESWELPVSQCHVRFSLFSFSYEERNP